MTIKYNSLPRKTLAEPITASATSFRLNNIKKWDGTDLAASDFGTEAYGVLRDAKGTVVEFFAFDPATIADADIDFEYRGLSYNGTNLTTEIAGNKLTWGKGTIVELGTHGPQIFQWLQELIEGIAISGSPDATLTQKGIVEIATSAEIDAGTAAGSTDAPLAMTPDQFAASDLGLALAGGETFGDPDTDNKFLTETYNTIDEQIFTESGTWTKPDKGNFAMLELWGAGGGGGGGLDQDNVDGGGSGGGGGAYVRRLFPLSTFGATETVTIGAGGAGGAVNTDGTAGGNTTFGAHLTAYGGGLGNVSSTTATSIGGGGGGMLGAGGAGSLSDVAAWVSGGQPIIPIVTVSVSGSTYYDISLGAVNNAGFGGASCGGTSQTLYVAGSALYGGGAGGASQNNGTAGAGGGSVFGGAGGGGGGNSFNDGGAGGNHGSYAAGGGGAAGAAGAVGGAGTAGASFGVGGGGGGGTTFSSGTGGAGGAGGIAAGGGGGGSTPTAGTAGVGGAGGAGYAKITVF